MYCAVLPPDGSKPGLDNTKDTFPLIRERWIKGIDILQGCVRLALDGRAEVLLEAGIQEQIPAKL